ncbi:MAG: TIGR03118 family protein [Verrucomicrobia bacterium]|nr:MAG: TIGR03118 family protein [Verrucomicrobiota bacterium]PYL62745.1 MAG: TIGR03118 family protein [Verrucomicrobiota bacterium]
MKTTHAYIRFALPLLAAAILTATSGRADTYSWTNFQSDIAGVAQHTDPHLVNPWGMAAGSSGTIWVSDNGTGVSTLYNQDGTANSLVVAIPPSASNTDGANPTGTVFNDTGFFPVSRNGTSASALFIFVSEDGSISGWNPTLSQTRAFKAVDNGSQGAVYKGVTLGVANGNNFLYVTNFHSGRVETYDQNFHRVTPNGFVDPSLPSGYGPFGIRNFNNEIFVTYAKQDQDRHDDVACPGCGLIDVFDTSGNFLRRLTQQGNLNAPWGLAEVDSELWVGNFGDGKINVYDPTTGAFIETLMRADGTPLQFDGLWDMLPLGNGTYFTAGIADESHGLFGIITED